MLRTKEKHTKNETAGLPISSFFLNSRLLMNINSTIFCIYIIFCHCKALS